MSSEPQWSSIISFYWDPTTKTAVWKKKSRVDSTPLWQSQQKLKIISFQHCYLIALHCTDVAFIASLLSVYVDTLCVNTALILFHFSLNTPTDTHIYTHIHTPFRLPFPTHHWTHSVHFSLDFNFQQWSTTFQHRTAASFYFISVRKKSTRLWSGKWGKLINSALINDSGRAF